MSSNIRKVLLEVELRYFHLLSHDLPENAKSEVAFLKEIRDKLKDMVYEISGPVVGFRPQENNKD